MKRTISSAAATEYRRFFLVPLDPPMRSAAFFRTAPARVPVATVSERAPASLPEHDWAQSEPQVVDDKGMSYPPLGFGYRRHSSASTPPSGFRAAIGNDELGGIIAELGQCTSSAPVSQWKTRARIEQSAREHHEMVDLLQARDKTHPTKRIHQPPSPPAQPGRSIMRWIVSRAMRASL